MVVRTCLQHAHHSFSSSTTSHRVIRTQWQQLALKTEETLTVKKRKRKKLSCSSRQTTNNFQSSLLPHTANSYCTNNFQIFVQLFEIFKSKVRMFPLKFDGISGNSFIQAHGNDDVINQMIKSVMFCMVSITQYTILQSTPNHYQCIVWPNENQFHIFTVFPWISIKWHVAMLQMVAGSQSRSRARRSYHWICFILPGSIIIHP